MFVGTDFPMDKVESAVVIYISFDEVEIGVAFNF